VLPETQKQSGSKYSSVSIWLSILASVLNWYEIWCAEFRVILNQVIHLQVWNHAVDGNIYTVTCKAEKVLCTLTTCYTWHWCSEITLKNHINMLTFIFVTLNPNKLV